VTVEVLRIRNANALLLPSIRAFVYRALTTNSLASHPAQALVELADVLHLDEVGLFLVKEDNHWAATALCEINTSALAPKACNVIHFYNAGSADARKALVQQIVAYAREAGVKMLAGVDMNTKPRAFARLFKDAGQARVVGELFLFDIGAE